MVAVFHWQAAGPVQPSLGQVSAQPVPRAGNTEAQQRGVGPRPRGQQASFTVINEGDGGGARGGWGVLVGGRRVGVVRVGGEGGGGAVGDFNRSVLNWRSTFILYCRTMENKSNEKEQ